MLRKPKMLALLAAPVLALGLTSRLAHADTQNYVNVTLEGQQQSMWCWATAADMVMSHFGAHVEQCEAVNQTKGRTDCCTDPTSAACNVGGFAGDPLSYNGFNYQFSTLTYAGFTQEIDAGRPVQIGYSWNGGGGHALVVRGYYTATSGGQWLLIDDPMPVGSGTESWVTYAQYVGGASPTYDHTAQTPLHHISDSPVCSANFVGLPSSSMQRCFDNWTHRGKRLATVAASSGWLITGSFQPQNGPWRAHWLLTPSDYQAKFDAYYAQGLRPESVSVLPTSSGPYFNAVWKTAENGFLSYTGLSAASLASTDAWLRPYGYYPTDLHAYDDQWGNPNFAATWVYKPYAGELFDIGLSSSSYQALFNSKLNAGQRPLRFSAYTSGGATQYAVLWTNNTTGFYHNFGLSQSGFAQTDATRRSQGFLLSNVTALNGTYSGIWTP